MKRPNGKTIFFLFLLFGVSRLHFAAAGGRGVRTLKRQPGHAAVLDTAEKPVMNFGVERFAEEPVMNRAFSALLGYLEEQLGQHFILNYFSNDEAIRRQLVQGRLQVAHFSSQSYASCLMDREPNIRYVATVAFSRGDPIDYYHGYIFTRRDYPEETLADFAGKSFAFVNSTSSSGFGYPMILFYRAGIDPKQFFSRVLFLGNHPAVTEGVLNKTVYAGATFDGNYRSANRISGGQLKIIAETPPIPNEPWVAGKGVSEAFIKDLQHVLVSIDPETLRENGERVFIPEFIDRFEIDSFTIRSDAFYNDEVELIQIMNAYSF